MASDDSVQFARDLTIPPSDPAALSAIAALEAAIRTFTCDPKGSSTEPVLTPLDPHFNDAFEIALAAGDGIRFDGTASQRAAFAAQLRLIDAIAMHRSPVRDELTDEPPTAADALAALRSASVTPNHRLVRSPLHGLGHRRFGSLKLHLGEIAPLTTRDVLHIDHEALPLPGIEDRSEANTLFQPCPDGLLSFTPEDLIRHIDRSFGMITVTDHDRARQALAGYASALRRFSMELDVDPVVGISARFLSPFAEPLAALEDAVTQNRSIGR